MVDLERFTKSVHNRADVAAARARGFWLRLTYGLAWSCGRGLMAGRQVEIQNYGRLRIGNHVTISSGSLLTVGPGCELEIGDDVFIGRYTVIAAAQSILIGERTDIAEHCTIRDADHDLSAEGRVKGRATMTPITIGRGCWIGAGVRLLRGSCLGDGVVVGANAVVRGTFAPETLIAGIPARVIKNIGREPNTR